MGPDNVTIATWRTAARSGAGRVAVMARAWAGAEVRDAAWCATSMSMQFLAPAARPTMHTRSTGATRADLVNVESMSSSGRRT